MQLKTLMMLAAALVVNVTLARAAQPDPYPAKPIRLVVPYPPGGGVDIVGRHVAQRLGEGLRQAVVVDNRSGAGGTLGAELVQRAAADGYTLMIISTSYAVNANLYRMPYDPVEQVSPVGLIGTAPFVLAVNPSVPAKSLKMLVALAKQSPGKLNYGSTGQGAITHLATELLNLMAGIRMTHIPYKGAGPALTDLLAGQIDVLLGSTLSTLPHVKSGKLRALAVTTTRRSPVLPDTPTVAESGVAGYDCALWYAILGPPNLPDPVSGRLNDELGRILSSAEMKDRLAREGMEPTPLGRAELRVFLKDEIAKWGRVVKAVGVKLE